MKFNLLNLSVIASSVFSIATGIVLYQIGTKKLENHHKRTEITMTKAHPIELHTRMSATPSIILRAGPAAYFPVVGQMTAKDDFKIIDQEGEWSRLSPIRNPAAAAWANLTE